MKSRRPLLVGLILIIATVAAGWAWLAKDRTTYASGFRQQLFVTIKPGLPRDDVERILGDPLFEQDDPYPETWLYDESVPRSESRIFRIFQPSESVRFDAAGRILKISGFSAERLRGIGDRNGVLRTLGSPTRRIAARARCAYYSRPSSFGRYKARVVAYTADGLVAETFAYETYD